MIPFTQYLRPNGRPVPVEIDRPPEIEAKAEAILAKGLIFECEHLSNGYASFTISDPEEGVDLAIELCPNGPDVPATIDRLIQKFNLGAPNAS